MTSGIKRGLRVLGLGVLFLIVLVGLFIISFRFAPGLLLYVPGSADMKGFVGTFQEDSDPALAARFFAAACDGGNMTGCGNLGLMYFNGNGVAKDSKRAAELHERACEGGEVRACPQLGWMYSNGEGVEKDSKRAAELYERGCDAGNMRACANLGGMYSNGEGVEKDSKRAAELWKRACDGGYSAACP